MKKRIITPLLFLLVMAGFSQNLTFDVHGKYTHPVKKEKLVQARLLSDIIPSYPAKWIMSYVATEVRVIRDGDTAMAAGVNDALSAEQINILQTTDLGTDIVINIRYKYNNPVTDNLEDGSMNYSATVVPETEAEYPGGYQQMTQYLKENAIDNISEEISGQIQPVVVGFTVNEKGKIADAQLSGTSGDPETDELLLEVINKMPKWKPAEDSKGIKVKQEFELSVGSGGC